MTVRGRRALALIAFAVVATAPTAGPRAEPPAVIRDLQERPLSMFDFGIKALRRAALDASLRFASPAEPGPAVRVWYDTGSDTIEMLFEFRALDVGAAPSRATCLERRRQAILETFKIDRTASLDLTSPEQRIRRRIGAQFSREPQPPAQQVLALGERLSELLFVGVEVADAAKSKITCRAPVAQLDPK